MASEFIDFSALTLNNEEARSAAELVFEQVYTKPEIVATHAIMTGVEFDKYIPIIGHRELVGKVDPGGCSNNDITDGIPTSQKTWTPKLISGRIINCQDNLPDKLKFWKKSRIAANTWEEIDNEYKAYVEDDTIAVMADSILRIADFSDTAEDVVANGGNLTAGTDKTYFNQLNGIWPQVIADQSGAALIYRHTISENSGATYLAQNALAADAALSALRNMYNNIDPRAFSGGNLVFQMTRSLFNNWSDFMEDKSLVFMLDRTESGATKFSYRGIPIVIRYDWDRILRQYFDNGVTIYLPHRAWLTDLNNIPIGTSDTESLSMLKSHFDQTTEKHYLKFAYKIDAKILLEYAMAVAY